MINLDLARELAETGSLKEASGLITQAMLEDINNPHALVLASYVAEREGKFPLAYHLAARITQMWPRESSGWTNLGRCADALWRMDEAERCYKRSLALCTKDSHRVTNLLNLAAMHLQLGEFDKARPYAERALAMDADNRKARHNLGMCQLAAHQWADGWKNYEGSLGSGNRIRWNYAGEPDWDGSPGKTVIIHGEQGLGDEICGASCFQDTIRISKRVVLDCDERLANLYKRSFPEAKVYGTRNAAAVAWDEEDKHPDASAACVQLGALFRRSDADFNGLPYLSPDLERVTGWDALWLSKRKPAIGLAWSGGAHMTGDRFRRVPLEAFKPLIESIDATYVCLQYKDASEEIAASGLPIRQFERATLTKDYDDTAGLVASLDAVVSVTTSVIHLAGALGVPTHVMVGECPQWRYGVDGDTMPWYQSVRLHRKPKGKEWPIGQVTDALQRQLGLRAAA